MVERTLALRVDNSALGFVEREPWSASALAGSTAGFVAAIKTTFVTATRLLGIQSHDDFFGGVVGTKMKASLSCHSNVLWESLGWDVMMS